VPEPLALAALGNGSDNGEGIQFAEIVMGGKLGDVALQVLGTHFVAGVLVCSFERGPEGFNAVGVDRTIHILGMNA